MIKSIIQHLLVYAVVNPLTFTALKEVTLSDFEEENYSSRLLKRAFKILLIY